MAVTRDALRPRSPAGMGRGLGLALLVHGGLLVAIAIGVSWRSSAPVAMEAELWSAVPQAAAPRAVAPEPVPPKPEPAPPPPPPPPPKPEPRVETPPAPDPQIAIEREKREREKALEQERERELEAQRREREKQRQLEDERREREQAEAERREQLAEKQAAEKKKQELEARRKAAAAEEARLEQARKDNLARLAGLAGATGGERATGTALQSSGPSAGYASRIVARVKPNIVFPDDVSGNPQAEVEVRAAPDGTIVARRIVRSSGVPSWDEAVLRAIDRTETLPRDTDGRVPSPMVINFRLRDL